MIFLQGWISGSLQAAGLRRLVATDQRRGFRTEFLRCQTNVVAGSGVVKLQCGGVVVSKWRRTSCDRSWRRTRMKVPYQNREVSPLQARASSSSKSDAPAAKRPAIMVIGLTGKMGRAAADAAVAAGLRLVPFTFVGRPVTNNYLDVKDVRVEVRHQSQRDDVLTEVLNEYPNVIIVDYTVPQAVNGNAEFYCRRGVPFVMGTTGGDRVKLNDVVLKSGVYAVIAPQMGKQVIAFQAAMQYMAEQFPGAFCGYKLQVTESHQSSKLDTSGTAKAFVASFVELGLDFDVSKIEKVRDPEQQIERMKVPEKCLLGHAFHTYRIVSPDNMVSFEIQHNVCGRSIYGEGTVDAVLFLAKKIEQESEKKLFNMIDVLREGHMR